MYKLTDWVRARVRWLPAAVVILAANVPWSQWFLWRWRAGCIHHKHKTAAVLVPPPRRVLCDRVGLSVGQPACLCAGLRQKWWADFIETSCCDCAYQSEELINCWWWSGPGYGFRITFPLPSASPNTSHHITSHGENGSRPQRPLYPRNNDRVHFILHKILYYNTTVSDAMEICFVIIHHVLIDPEFI